jgi:hypothetical protein
MSSYTAVVVDHENNAEVWWEYMRKWAPAFALALSRHGVVVVPRDLCDILRGAPGYNDNDGPDFAPFPVLFYEEGSPGWDEVTSQKHLFFEELS